MGLGDHGLNYGRAFAVKPGRRERKFWMQRQGAKILTKTRKGSQRPKADN